MDKNKASDNLAQQKLNEEKKQDLQKRNDEMAIMAAAAPDHTHGCIKHQYDVLPLPCHKVLGRQRELGR